MCGFLASNFQVDATTIGYISSRLASRGPDDVTVRSADWGTYVFSRLAINDRGPSGMQPMRDEIGSHRPIVLFNGEIYNHADIARSKKLPALLERPLSDTAVVQQFLEQNPMDEFLKHANGMFAICSISDQFRSVSLCRDIYGQKPLYYWCQGGQWIVSSDLPAIVRLAAAPISPVFLQKYLSSNEDFGTRGAFSLEDTAFQGVRSVVPGSIINIGPLGAVRDDGPRQQIWAMQFRPLDGEVSDVDDLIDSVARTVSRYTDQYDDATFAFSGGLDSSLLCLTALSQGKSIEVFTKVSEGIDHIASRSVELFQSLPGVTLNEVSVKQSDYVDDFIDFVQYSAAPARWGTAPSIQPLYRRMRETKFKICLGGDGADEIFFGYPNHQKLLADYQEGRSMSALEWVKNYSFSGTNKMSSVNYDDELVELISEFEALNGSSGTSLHQLQELVRFVDLNHFFPSIVASHSDACAMQHSVELRSPFLDFNLVKFGFRRDALPELGAPIKPLIRAGCVRLAESLGLDGSFFSDQKKEGTRNFALQAFSQFDCAKIVDSDFERDIGVDLKALRPSKKLNFKIFSAYVFYLLYGRHWDRDDVKRQLSLLRI